MKKIIYVILFLISAQGHAQSLAWPRDFYSIDSLNQRFYAPFKNYFDQIFDLYPVQYLPQGFRIYDDHGHHIELEVSFQRTGSTAVFYYRTHEKNFSMVVTAQDLNSLEDIARFDLSTIVKQAEFEIYFPEIDYLMRKKTIAEKTEMLYDPSWGEVFLNELRKKAYSESRMWFNCAQCSGEPLIFTQDLIGDQVIKHYFIGGLVNEVAPQRFLEMANMWYLSSLFRQSDSIISSMKKYFPELSD